MRRALRNLRTSRAIFARPSFVNLRARKSGTPPTEICFASERKSNFFSVAFHFVFTVRTETLGETCFFLRQRFFFLKIGSPHTESVFKN
jgi:hypothetical protein